LTILSGAFNILRVNYTAVAHGIVVEHRFVSNEQDMCTMHSIFVNVFYYKFNEL